MSNAKRGPEPKPAESLRSERLTVVLTPAELAELQVQAAADNRRVGEYARIIIARALAAEPTQRTKPTRRSSTHG